MFYPQHWPRGGVVVLNHGTFNPGHLKDLWVAFSPYLKCWEGPFPDDLNLYSRQAVSSPLYHPSPPFSTVSLSFPLPSLSIPEVLYHKKEKNFHTLDMRCRERSRGGRLETVWMLYLLFWKNRLIFVGKNTVITLILKRVPSCRHGNQQLPLADFCHSFWSACFGPECGWFRDGVPVIKSGRATICLCLWWTWGSACVMCICGEWERSPPSQLDSTLFTSWKDTLLLNSSSSSAEA